MDAAAAPALPAGAKRPLEAVGKEEPQAILAKLRRLDPEIRTEEYLHSGDGSNGNAGGPHWDIKGLMEDLLITQRYSAEALDTVLRPMRDAIKRTSEPKRPKPAGAVEVIPGTLLLGDAVSARDTDAIRELGIRRVVNCSPQTVRTGRAYYGPNIAYMELWEDDLPDFCVLEDFEPVYEFATAGGPCLIHCEQGVNRSGALAVAILMKMRAKEDPQLSPEEVLRASWLYVIERKVRLLTNPSFQRQLLLFAMLGFRWFPSVVSVWRTPKERKMAQFRVLATRIGQSVVGSSTLVPPKRKWRAVVYIRDGTMRGEMRMEEAFDLSSAEAQRKAEHRIKAYAVRSLNKLTGDDLLTR